VSYKGYKHSPEAKAKMSEQRKGRKHTEDFKKKLSLKLKGKKLSMEASKNIQQGIIDKRYTQEYAKKLSDTKIGEINPQAILNEHNVLLIRQEYKELLDKGYKKTETQYSLAKKYGVKRPTISDVVLNRTWKHLL
jgi:hypothetical protein